MGVVHNNEVTLSYRDNKQNAELIDLSEAVRSLNLDA
jgi:hypothetical protein